MKKKYDFITNPGKAWSKCWLVVLMALLHANVYAQTCTTDLLKGQNLVKNPDFSQGYAGWTHAANYIEGKIPGPGHIWVGTNPKDLNGAFYLMKIGLLVVTAYS